jgi:hypothetical protein
MIGLIFSTEIDELSIPDWLVLAGVKASLASESF